MLLESAFREALCRADVVIATGGLGPTADDLTREAAAAATGRRLLRRDPAIVEALRARFARYGRTMSATNEKQADVLEGASALPNARGTAPGQLLEHEGRVLVLLPGPPGEMKPMFDEQVLARLRARAGSHAGRAPPRPADRGDARERGGRDRRARLLALREPEDHDPRGGGAGRAAPRRARRRRRRRPTPASRSWPRPCARLSPAGSTRRTAATCRRWWWASCASAGSPSPSPSPAPGGSSARG